MGGQSFAKDVLVIVLGCLCACHRPRLDACAHDHVWSPVRMSQTVLGCLCAWPWLVACAHVIGQQIDAIRDHFTGNSYITWPGGRTSDMARRLLETLKNGKSWRVWRGEASTRRYVVADHWFLCFHLITNVYSFRQLERSVSASSSIINPRRQKLQTIFTWSRQTISHSNANVVQSVAFFAKLCF